MAISNIMMSMVFPLPRRPAVTKKTGRSGISERSISVSPAAMMMHLPTFGGHVAEPIVQQEPHGYLHSIRVAVLGMRQQRLDLLGYAKHDATLAVETTA